MFSLQNYPTDLQTYLHEMENELNRFQQLMTETFSKMKKEEYFSWFLKNNEPVQVSGILSYSVKMESEADTNIAKERTFKKHVETMNVFYRFNYGFEPFKNL